MNIYLGTLTPLAKVAVEPDEVPDLIDSKRVKTVYIRFEEKSGASITWRVTKEDFEALVLPAFEKEAKALDCRCRLIRYEGCHRMEHAE